MAASHRLIETLIECGADIVELGVPFSDPIADGPVVQRSAHEALLAGITPDRVFELAAAHSPAVPFVVLTYLNPVLAYGVARFFEHARRAGIEALVIPDLPLDEAGPYLGEARRRGLAIVPMATPTSTDERLELVARAACEAPFVYCVAATGVTGARSAIGDELPGLIARLRLRTETPLAVGFGVSTPELAAQVARLADGVIVGSALIEIVLRCASQEESRQAVGELIEAASSAIAQCAMDGP